MTEEHKMNISIVHQLKVIDFIQKHLELSFKPADIKTLFDFYTRNSINVTASEMTQLLLDILFAANIRPMIISDAILTNVLREFCWKSCTGHECTISWKEFTSFFESQKQPFTKLLTIAQSLPLRSMDSGDVFTAKHVTFQFVKSNKSKIFNFDFDEDDRSRLKSAISKLAPTVSAHKIFTFIVDEKKVSALIIGTVDMTNNGTQIEVNDIVYSIDIDSVSAAFPHTNNSEFYASEIMTVYIDGINNAVTSVQCYSFLKISRFMSIVYDKLNISDQNKLLLIHNHLIVNATVDKDKSLEYYNVKNDSCLLAYAADGKYSGHSNNFAEFGGVNPLREPFLARAMKLSLEEYEAKKFMDTQKDIRDKCCLLKLSDTFEFVEDLDILTYEMNQNCIKMSCGHGITKATLYQYTMIQLQNYETLIKCPHIIDDSSNKLCNAVWYYPEIRNVLFSNNGECNESKSIEEEYSIKDIIKLDRMCAMNGIRDDYKTKECIKCHSLLYKNKHSTAGWCPICDHRFCWKCDGECDAKCSSNLENEVLDILKDCALKTIGSVQNVPSIRCCPRCLQLITHTTACKHVSCAACKCAFCFVCMKPKKYGQWQCGRYSDVCPVAPNEVPNIDDTPGAFDQNRMMGGMNGFGPPGLPNMLNMGGNPMMNMGMHDMPPPNPMMGGMPPPNPNVNGMAGPPPNMGGMPPWWMQGPPPNMGGMPPPNMGGMPPPWMQGPPMGGMGGPPPNMGGMGGMGGMGPPPNMMGGPPPNMMGGMPPMGFMGGPPSPPPNWDMNMGMPPDMMAPNNVGDQ